MSFGTSLGGFWNDIAFTFRSECSRFDIIVVRVKSCPNDFESVRVHSQEFWFEAGIKTEHILIDQDLSADMWPRSNAYCGNLEKVCYSSRSLSGHTLEHNTEASCIFQLARIRSQ